MNCPECGDEMVPDGGINRLDGRPVYGGWYCPCALARAERETVDADAAASRAFGIIQRMGEQREAADQLSNMQLAERLLSLWGKMDVDSEESALIATVIDRLQGVNVPTK